MVTTQHTTHSAHWFKMAGLIILLFPIAVLLLFAVAETIGGDLSGLQHLVQAAPLILLAVLAWTRPWLGGLLLIGLGVVLAALYPFVMRDFPPGALLINELILFGPAIVAGLLFVLAGRRNA